MHLQTQHAGCTLIEESKKYGTDTAIAITLHNDIKRIHQKVAFIFELL